MLKLTSKVAMIQHEFGIFDPRHGAAILTLMRQLEVPVIVTLHSVPIAPSNNQRAILERVVDMADAVVVMSTSALQILPRKYNCKTDKLVVIAHGAHCFASHSFHNNARPVVVTWGLIGPGTGLEQGIRALPCLRDLDPKPIYRVWGEPIPTSCAGTA